VASLGFGNALFVRDFMRKLVSGPEIRIIATPEAPIPVDKAHIVMNILYNEFNIRISLLYYDHLVSFIPKEWKHLAAVVFKKLFSKARC